MSNTDLILSTALQYTAIITNLINNPVSIPARTYLNYESGEPDPKDYDEYIAQVRDIRVKTKLLFSAFQHGSIFLQEIKNAEESLLNASEDNHILKVMKRNLELMTEHIQTFTSKTEAPI